MTEMRSSSTVNLFPNHRQEIPPNHPKTPKIPTAPVSYIISNQNPLPSLYKKQIPSNQIFVSEDKRPFFTPEIMSFVICFFNPCYVGITKD